MNGTKEGAFIKARVLRLLFFESGVFQRGKACMDSHGGWPRFSVYHPVRKEKASKRLYHLPECFLFGEKPLTLVLTAKRRTLAVFLCGAIVCFDYIPILFVSKTSVNRFYSSHFPNFYKKAHSFYYDSNNK